MYCIIKCIRQGKQARVKNADLRHPSFTVVMRKRKSASPVLNVLKGGGSQRCYEVRVLQQETEKLIIRRVPKANSHCCRHDVRPSIFPSHMEQRDCHWEYFREI